MSGLTKFEAVCRPAARRRRRPRSPAAVGLVSLLARFAAAAPQLVVDQSVNNKSPYAITTPLLTFGGNPSAYNLDGGTLTAGRLQTGSTGGTFNFNGGTAKRRQRSAAGRAAGSRPALRLR